MESRRFLAAVRVRPPLLPAIPIEVGLAVLVMLAAAGAGILIGNAALQAHEAVIVIVGLVGLGTQLVGRRHRAAVVMASIAYVGALGWAYAGPISVTYDYQGLVNRHPGLGDVLITSVLAILPAVWLPLGRPRPTLVVLWTLFVLGYVPSIVVPVYLYGSLDPTLGFSLLLAASMMGLAWMGGRSLAPLPDLGLRPRAFDRLILILAFACLLYVALAFGVSFSIPNLEDVYDTRAEFRSALGIGALTALGGYVIPWAGNVVNPVLMSLGLLRRRASWILLALIGQLLIYSVTGFKSVLFTVALVPMVYVAVSLAPRLFAVAVSAGTPLLLGICVLLTSAIASPWPLALITRLLATPGQVTAQFLDYFSAHPHFGLSHSLLRGIVPSPYSEDPPFVIGAAYFSRGTNANGGIWADAFANFGIPGIVAFTVVLGAVLLVLDAIAEGRDVRLTAPLLTIAGLSLANAALLTTIMTLGLGAAALLIAIMPRGTSAGEQAFPGPPSQPPA